MHMSSISRTYHYCSTVLSSDIIFKIVLLSNVHSDTDMIALKFLCCFDILMIMGLTIGADKG